MTRAFLVESVFVDGDRIRAEEVAAGMAKEIPGD
jgi:hypothetical protein